jgi:hypothetical protein
MSIHRDQNVNKLQLGLTAVSDVNALEMIDDARLPLPLTLRTSSQNKNISNRKFSRPGSKDVASSAASM